MTPCICGYQSPAPPASPPLPQRDFHPRCPRHRQWPRWGRRSSLKVKNVQNKKFLFCRVITKIRGSLVNPSNQYKTWIWHYIRCKYVGICINKLQILCMHTCITPLQNMHIDFLVVDSDMRRYLSFISQTTPYASILAAMNFELNISHMFQPCLSSSRSRCRTFSHHVVSSWTTPCSS
jgi:hypothetical protein